MSSYEVTGARLSVPFETRGRWGRVDVVVHPNEDPVKSGHTFIAPDVAPGAMQGFPVVTASVHLDAIGPAGVFGWIQLVTQHLTPLCGYRMAGGRPGGLLPLRAVASAGWRDLRVVLEREYPSWRADL